MARSRKKKPKRAPRSGAATGPKAAERAGPEPAAASPEKSEDTTGGARTPRWHWAVGLGLAVVFVVLGSLTKVAPSHEVVLGGDEVRLLDADSYYHLRHTRYAAKHWPDLNRWDVMTHYPVGQRAPSVGLLELGAGAVAAATGPATDEHVARVLAWAPVVLAAAVIAFLFLCGNALRGPLFGAAFAGLATLYPGGMAGKLLLGFADHHALEATLTAALFWQLVVATRGTSKWAGSGLGVVLALFVLSWLGAPLLVAIVAIATAVAWVAVIAAGGAAEKVSRAGVRCFATLAAVLAVIGVAWPDAMLDPGLYFPTVAGAGATAVAFGLAPLLSRGLAALPRSRRWLALGVLLLPVVAAIGLAALSPSIRLALVIAIGPKLSTVAEHAKVDLGSLLALYGLALPMAIVGVVWATTRAFRQIDVQADAALAVAGAAVVALHVASNDYNYLAPIGVVAGAGLALCALVTVRKRVPGGALLLAAAVLTLIVLPLVGVSKKPWLRKSEARAMEIFGDPWSQATTWLRERSLPSSLDPDTTAEPFEGKPGGFAYPEGSYGVMVPWSWGNFIAAKGKRPVVWSQGAADVLARWFTLDSEDAALAELALWCQGPERFRYVVIDAWTLGPQLPSLFGQAGSPLEAVKKGRNLLVDGKRIPLMDFGPRVEASLAARLYLDDGAELGHFRRVYDTPSEHLVAYKLDHRESRLGRIAWPVSADNRADYQRFAGTSVPTLTQAGFIHGVQLEPTIKIFEIVAGAELAGTAPAGSEVEAVLELQHRLTGRRTVYRRLARAGDDGRFSLRLAYPTENARDTADITAMGPYRLQVGDQVRRVEISEAQVREGARIPLP